MALSWSCNCPTAIAPAHEIGKLRVVQGGYRTAEFFNGL